MSAEVQYTLSEENFLDFHIYTSIRSKTQRSQRQLSRIVTALLVGLVAYYYFSKAALSLAYVHTVLAVLLFLCYHKYSFWKYKRHFIKHIREHRSGMIGPEYSIELVDGQIVSESEMGDGNLNPSAIEELVELENIYIIAFKQSQSVILPRRGAISGIPRKIMKELSNITSLPLTDRRKLKWK